MTPNPKSDRSNKQTISMEFDLQHPPEKVWRALTEPALLAEWLLPLVNRNLQLEPGKAFRFQAPPLPGWEGSVNCAAGAGPTKQRAFQHTSFSTKENKRYSL